MSTVKELVCKIDFYTASGEDIVGKIARYILRKAQISSQSGFSNEEALDAIKSLHPKIDRRLYDQMLREAMKMLNEKEDVYLSHAALIKYKADIKEYNFRMDKQYQIGDDIIDNIDERIRIVENHLEQINEKYEIVAGHYELHCKLMSLVSLNVGGWARGEIV